MLSKIGQRRVEIYSKKSKIIMDRLGCRKPKKGTRLSPVTLVLLIESGDQRSTSLIGENHSSMVISQTTPHSQFHGDKNSYSHNFIEKKLSNRVVAFVEDVVHPKNYFVIFPENLQLCG